ncbi:MAG TPA: arsenate reductase (glutaredoxin) [Planctomycetaceae bacterium]|nr:arsenate reductase (glutaredoxin) [Planctomycetaceae bacterium]
MPDVTIYHNPRCSKSRQTLKLVEDRKLEHTVVEYLKDPPTEDTLRSIVQALGIDPQDLLRKKEQIFKEVCPGGDPAADEAIQLMVDHPKLIERPIVVVGDKAAVGRPPENVLPLLPAD